jgi:hypothetical protein
MVKLVGASSQLPSSLLIHGVKIDEAAGPWRAGGFADIYRGSYGGTAVVAKRFRVHITTDTKLRSVRGVQLSPFACPAQLVVSEIMS